MLLSQLLLYIFWGYVLGEYRFSELLCLSSPLFFPIPSKTHCLKVYFLYNKSPSQVIFWLIFVWYITFICFQPLWFLCFRCISYKQHKVELYFIESRICLLIVYIHIINLLIYFYHLIFFSYLCVFAFTSIYV